MAGARSPAAEARFVRRLAIRWKDIEWVPTGKNIALIGSLDCFFTGPGDNVFDLSINGAYRFQSRVTMVQPYAGAGLGITHHPVTYKPTTLGSNLIAGSRFRTRGHVEPFVELRLRIAIGYSHFSPTASPIIVTGGLLF